MGYQMRKDVEIAQPSGLRERNWGISNWDPYKDH